MADEAQVEALRQQLGGPALPVVAVGSGTVNDIAKAAAHQAGVPYAVVATAPSMNGYTSALAALLCRRVKTTQTCRPPVACLMDLEVLASAPYEMIAAGFGDLLSKPVCNADWRLAHHLLGAPWSSETMALVEAAARLTDGIAPKLRQRNLEAMGRLALGLVLSGFAMTLAGSSTPASGAEHLISHYLDMEHFAMGEPHDLHGRQVGVGNLVSALFYQQLLRLSPAAVDVAARVQALRPWPEYAAGISAEFGVLADPVLEPARQLYPDAPERRQRLDRLKSDWERITSDLAAGLRSPEAIGAELEAAGCPVSFADLGVSAARARRAILRAKDIRGRYTILHLAWDLGLLEQWTDEALPQVVG